MKEVNEEDEMKDGQLLLRMREAGKRTGKEDGQLLLRMREVEEDADASSCCG